MNERMRGKEDRIEHSTFSEAFTELQGILNTLKDMGYTIPDYCSSEQAVQEEWERKTIFPIAREGVDGIRASRSRNGRFRVSFTNGFDNPADSKRIDITEKLRAKGYIVL